MKTTITITTKDKLPDAYNSWEDYLQNLLEQDEIQFLIDESPKLSVNLYGYEDEDTGEFVYDTESIAEELGRQFTLHTGQDWSDF